MLPLTIIHYYCNLSAPLINPTGNVQKGDIYPCSRAPCRMRTLIVGEAVGRKGSAAVSEDSLLERVTAAAEERQLSHNSLIAYRRTWLKIIARQSRSVG